MAVHFVDPGMLRTELTLERAIPAGDGAGGHAENWREVATLFGRIEPMRADSRFGAGQTLETVTHCITLRFRDGVESGMRFVKGSRKFEIVTVHDPDETGRYLVCRAREAGR